MAAAAAAKSPQSCPTLCDPIDDSPPGSSIPGILQARTLEWVAISFSNAWKWNRSVLSNSSDPMDCSLPGFSVHGIFQARVLEWVSLPSPWLRGRCSLKHLKKERKEVFLLWINKEQKGRGTIHNNNVLLKNSGYYVYLCSFALYTATPYPSVLPTIDIKYQGHRNGRCKKTSERNTAL